MVKISSFQALRPIHKLAHKVLTQPYGNYSEEDIIKEKQANPYSFLNIIHQKNIKNTGKRLDVIREKINDFKENKILIKDQENCLYIYQQSKGSQKYIGLICTVDLKEYTKKKIKIHEKTIKKRELLFSKYLETTKIHAEPVLITYAQNNQYVKKKHMRRNNQLYNFSTKDKIQHTIWKIHNTHEIDTIIACFQNIKNLYIADGHHRMASSSKLKNNSRCLAYILPKNMLRNYAFHRVLKINNQNRNMLKDISKRIYTNRPKKKSKNIQFYIDQKWYEIAIKNEKDILSNLCVTKLLNKVLLPIFSVKDERDSKHIRFVPGNKSLSHILQSISDKEVLFWMNEISIEKIIEISNQNKTTPPKSTFILPKIPSGLIMMELP